MLDPVPGLPPPSPQTSCASSGAAVQVHPGQSALAFYTATNLSDKAITGVSTYNVAPMQAGVYFNKIQCFCFEAGLVGMCEMQAGGRGEGAG